jgi:hypothetical protein
MLDLILLPWILFKYVFSLGLWFALFMTLHYQCKKHNVWTKIRKIRFRRPDFFKRNQKKYNDGQDDYYNSL